MHKIELEMTFFSAVNSVCLTTDKTCPPSVIPETCCVQPVLKNLHWSPNLRLFQGFLIFPIRKVFCMIPNLHVPCYTLSLVLCTLHLKNKLFFSSSSIFYVFRECYHIPSQSDLLQTKQPPYFNLSSLVMFWTSDHPCWSFLDIVQPVPSFLNHGAQNWREESTAEKSYPMSCRWYSSLYIPVWCLLFSWQS